MSTHGNPCYDQNQLDEHMAQEYAKAIFELRDHFHEQADQWDGNWSWATKRIDEWIKEKGLERPYDPFLRSRSEKR